MSEARKGEKNPMYGKDGPFKGKTHFDVTKAKISEAKSGANHHLFGKTHSEEVKNKMSLAHTGEKHHFFGKTHSEETKQKMSMGHSGENHYLFGKSQSEETKLKISMKIGSPVEVYDLETNTKINYITVKKAAESLSCSVVTIRTYIKSQKPYKGRYIIQRTSDRDESGEQECREPYVTPVNRGPSELAGSPLNRGIGEVKGNIRFNLEIMKYSRAALSKVKAILLEVYLIGAYLIGPSLARDRASKCELGLDNWVLTKGHFNRGVNYTLNLGKRLPAK